MNPPRIAATVVAAAALTLVGAAAHAQAQAQDPSTKQTSHIVDPNTMSSVGGSPAPQVQTGAPGAKTHAEVYRDLVESERNGEYKRIQAFYNGN